MAKKTENYKAKRVIKRISTIKATEPVMQDVSKFIHPITCEKCGKTRETTYPYSECNCESKPAKQQELKCGCGGEITLYWSLGRKDCFVSCDNQKCKFSSGSFLTEAEAIDAFQLATSQDLIASQAKKIEQLQKLAHTYPTQEDIDAEKFEIHRLQQQIADLKAEVERLKGLLKELAEEGFMETMDSWQERITTIVKGA
jgi:hypothetical protein